MWRGSKKNAFVTAINWRTNVNGAVLPRAVQSNESRINRGTEINSERCTSFFRSRRRISRISSRSLATNILLLFHNKTLVIFVPTLQTIGRWNANSQRDIKLKVIIQIKNLISANYSVSCQKHLFANVFWFL